MVVRYGVHGPAEDVTPPSFNARTRVSKRKIAGSQIESLFQPEWSPEGVLHFVSDRTGWWNPYRDSSGQIEALFSKEAEFGQPLWNLGASTYAFAGGGRIVCTYRESGKTRITVLDNAGSQRELDLPFTEVSKFLRCAMSVSRGAAVRPTNWPASPA